MDNIYKPEDAKELPDNALWKNRFEIKSETSGATYIIAQNKTTGRWGCSCPSWKMRSRNWCKHLEALRVPIDRRSTPTASKLRGEWVKKRTPVSRAPLDPEPEKPVEKQPARLILI